MDKRKVDQSQAEELRRQAEARLRFADPLPEEISPAEAKKMIHELRVHQIELEMQNDELRQAQEILEESRSRYSDLYDFAPIGYLTLDELGIIKEANLTASLLLAAERSRLIDRQFTHFLVTEDRGAFRRHFNLALKGRERQTVELRLKREDGKEVFILLESVLHQDIAGRSLVRTAFSDISKRRQAEAALQSQQEELQNILDSVPALIFYKDKENRFIRINKALAEAMGLPKEDMDGKSVFDLYPAQAEDYWKDDQEVMRSGKPKRNIVETLETPEGVRWVQTDKIPYRDDQGNIIGVIGFSNDITERKQTEEALQRAHDELEERVKQRTADLQHTVEQLQWEIKERQHTEAALKESEQRLRYLTSQLLTAQEEERKRLALELHDDLGQSLMVLKMQLRAIQRKALSESSETRESLEDPLNFINEIIERIRRLSHNLRPAIMEDLGLTAAVQHLFEEFSRQDIHVTMDLDDTEGLFSPEAQLNIYRICQESFNNITKYAQASQVSVSLKRRDGCVGFQIEDNGRGFDHQKVINEYITDRGLGLTAMDERARMLEGSLKIWSKEGQGTKITLIVPIQGK
jgi:PAS domain S-box-containing protein